MIPEKIVKMVLRPSPAYYEENEIIEIVEEYIFQKKNVRVTIDIYRDIDIRYINHPVIKSQVAIAVKKLHQAFDVANTQLHKIINEQTNN